MRIDGAKFSLGRCVMTIGVDSLIRKDVGLGRAVGGLLERHACGDWGEISRDDAKLNEQAIDDGTRILSAYVVDGIKFWIITEADRSVTTVLLPEEY